MSVVSLVFGILSIIATITVCGSGCAVIIFAPVGFILGIIGLILKGNRNAGIAWAGIILNVIFGLIALLVLGSAEAMVNEFERGF